MKPGPNRIIVAVCGLLFLGFPPAAVADECIFRDSEHVRIERMIAARDYAKALDTAKALHAAYDMCQKSSKTAADLRTMNRAWRADAAIVIGGIYKATGRQVDTRRWIEVACRDYTLVVNATNIDTTTRKMASEAIGRNCKR